MWRHVIFTEIHENFAVVTSFDLEDVDLGSPNLHSKEFPTGPSCLPNLVILAPTGAEIVGGGQNMPPFQCA